MKNNKSAFTLVELMVVLAIIALLSALIFGAISSIREGNKRGSCQSNLNQIHAALRLYAQDNDGQFPYRNPGIADNTSASPDVVPSGGLGLWSLYVYPVPPSQTPPDSVSQLPYANSENDVTKAATLASYLKSPRAFHCPSDNSDIAENGATGKVSSGEVEYVDTSGNRRLNPDFLSYQGVDQTTSEAVYSSFRGDKVKRQLRYMEQVTSTTVARPDRRAPDQAVVTWCRFHRTVDATTGAVKSPEKTFDNVLFLDGSVQSVPVEQTVTLSNGSASATCRGWKRVPLAEANAVPQYVIDACNATP